MKIYFVRHTAVDVPSGTCYGQSDVGLAGTFLQEASVVKEKLSGITWERIYTSPLSRCRRLADYCGYPDAATDVRLKELDFGEWEMQQWDELDMSPWEIDWIGSPPPGGESFRQMYTRVAAFLDEIKKEDLDTLIFSHGGVIRCALIYFGETTFEKAFDKSVDYGEVVVFG